MKRIHLCRGLALGVCCALLTIPVPRATGDEIPAGALATAAELRDRALAGTRAFEFVRDLTTEVGSRFAGTPGDRAAVAWALRRLAAYGLENVRAEEVEVPRWVRGEIRGEILAPHPRRAVLAALGGSVGTPEEGIEAEVVEVASLEALRELPEVADGPLAGKIVFINKRMEARRDGMGYRNTVGGRSRGPAEAARRGAVALLLRSVGTSHDRLAHTGGTRYAEDVPAIPAAALSNPDADVLEALLADPPGGEAVRFRLYLDSRVLPPARSANVLAEVRGREKPEEVVLLGAHLDSWDLGLGAVDDGAGCAIVAEAARLLRELPRPPRRTVRVVLFANEEFGLSGARAYAAERGGEVARHAAAAESDFGAGAVWRFASRVSPEALPAVAEIARLLAPLGIEYTGNEAFGGADLRPLREAGVPLFDLSQDGTLYFDVHHTDNDTADKIDPRNLDQNVAAYAALAYLAAELEVDFRPVPPDEEEAR